MIESLRLTNFTKFLNLPIQFSSRINIIIGENGTGKTQLLKAAYLANAMLSDKCKNDDFAKRLCRIYRPAGDSIGKLIRHGTSAKAYAEIDAIFSGGQRLQAKFTSASKIIINSNVINQSAIGSPIFLPTKEILSLLSGIKNKESDLKTIESIFDNTYLDLCDKLLAEKSVECEDMIEINPRFVSVYEKLVNTIEGRFSLVDYNGEVTLSLDSGSYKSQRDKKQHKLNTRMQTKFIANKGESISVNMAAEGIRKLGVIQLLLQNRQFNPGQTGTLFWDEPETNMNPKLMRLLVEILLELSRNGQQIVIATHDYVLLKWFDLLMDADKDDHVLFHTLYRDQDTSAIKVASTDDYLNIIPNPIDEAFGLLINQEIEKDMGNLGK
jgi:AAA15 family ATPase/GTPase